LAYKGALDAAFVRSQSSPGDATLAAVKQHQEALPKTHNIRKQVREIEEDVYQALLDKVLDDGFVTEDEARTIAQAERVLQLTSDAKLRAKKEIFSAAYVEAIQDRRITQDELDTLRNLIVGLGVPKEEVEHELGIVREIIRSQSLKLPFAPIPADQVAPGKQKSEDAFFQCSAEVLSRRKCKRSSTGYEYTVKRRGTLVVTNKRVFIVGDGTTSIRYSDIADLDVDIDEGMIEVSKTTSGRPMFLKVGAPIYTARVIDVLIEAQRSEVPA